MTKMKYYIPRNVCELIKFAIFVFSGKKIINDFVAKMPHDIATYDFMFK